VPDRTPRGIGDALTGALPETGRAACRCPAGRGIDVDTSVLERFALAEPVALDTPGARGMGAERPGLRSVKAKRPADRILR